MENSWKPIETAPVGTSSTDQILVGFWGQFSFVYFIAYPNGINTRSYSHAKPTHWIELPAPPRVQCSPEPGESTDSAAIP